MSVGVAPHEWGTLLQLFPTWLGWRLVYLRLAGRERGGGVQVGGGDARVRQQRLHLEVGFQQGT